MRTASQDYNIAAALCVTGGQELAHCLLYGVEDVSARVATRLLGQHRSGYWLRQFCVPAADAPSGLWYVLDLAQSPPSVNWWHVCAALQDRACFRESAADLAMLEIAASIAGPHRVNLRAALGLLDDQEQALALDALAEAVGRRSPGQQMR
ncbi:hypothetical protein [Streptomyces sp. NBC_01431]|uniref:hypothetical protein n=1 Tax=Streptomyces sp. NBC_01431 TaxID=2903863 RepID=UPI002E37F833|nr:hypothetical protein [Streptomyces sp. NBC_01431]